MYKLKYGIACIKSCIYLDRQVQDLLQCGVVDDRELGLLNFLFRHRPPARGPTKSAD